MCEFGALVVTIHSFIISRQEILKVDNHFNGISITTWILVQQEVRTYSIGNDTHAHSDTALALITYPNHCPTSCRTKNHFVSIIGWRHYFLNRWILQLAISLHKMSGKCIELN